MRILAVDDDPIILDLLGLALSNSPYNDFELTSSSEEALQLLEESEDPFECFLLDIRMPGMDGIELCKRIREYPEYDQTPIIMVTRLDHRNYLERAIMAGASDYVVKPFEGPEVIMRIELAEVRRLLMPHERMSKPFLVPSELCNIAQGRVSEAFPLKGVSNFFNLQDMTYRLMDLPMFTQMTFLGLKVTNAPNLHAQLSREKFQNVMGKVGKAAAGALQNKPFMMSHHGNGILSIVIATNKLLSHRRLGASINQAFRNIPRDTQARPHVVIASSGPPKHVPKSERVVRLRRTLKSVRQMSEKPEAEQLTDW
ncbi:Signal transduction histidine-protein kinase BarA [Roseivivax sp. THAF40]|uniref:response regulator n=1 Tax=unclassified Roseivivax TaxID=2639302 RepID=UPI00126790BF|nr:MULTISPECIES: response regulator [unclassified Roseivivax]QFS83760.1 Signal transduction histidine-protein kinase BarA [Roseivivax sp. THAF197b]QFT47562.1 Signal transduction histidine-protein kinase BarA [Roseivivax sp. THAF40]